MKRTNSHLKRKKSKIKGRISYEGSEEEEEEDNEGEYERNEEEEEDYDDDEGKESEEDEEATPSEENKFEDLSKSKSKSKIKYVPFLGSSWLDQSFWELGDFCEQPSITEKEQTKERNQDFSFCTLFLSFFPSDCRTICAVVTQRPLFFENLFANPIEVVHPTLKLENVCGKMDVSLEEQIRTKVNFIRLVENKIDNYDQSVTILSRTLRVFVYNTHKMLSKKPLSNFLVKGKASSMQLKDGKKMNIVNYFPPSKAKKTSFVRFCCPHQLLTLIFKVEFELLIPIPLPHLPVSDGSFFFSKEGRFGYEAPKVMISDKEKRKICVVWKEFRPLRRVRRERER
ncbi:putative DDE superfamily endoclease [Monocercomonoides exilis]|uniref:putative DDE superfamily endoclease n=1 Tax=Monocercomonoides exilis TaxID=2049356 RepID=UPI00355A353C|nr:putative DDE superfamily endoclease [Monocercomonoides exilis]|eukprot:MONOS_9580.1-p1 / transcript=MONOS_9580.1 / gene=MONOS_9580 / organism=Monocercomonoides_exilis_PA203 / gene_product=DDE superfamily endoclease / transcript_product=DDE superfamily endoclease / location=Mono_scaffold00400:49994-51112(+) / protein_length=341 / sequence_SO=supercontig / SO=protein_coding / is_pseudo=false